MRTLEKNKVTLWLVKPATLTPELDSNGFMTGQNVLTYSTPIQIRLSLYPSNSDIVEQLFGKDCSFDMVSVSNSVILSKDSMLYYSQPIANFGTTYDYKVDKIAHSLNTYGYGLKGRI